MTDTSAWALLVETVSGGVEVYRGGLTLPGAKAAADALIESRSDIRQISVYPIEGSHAEGMATWLRTQDGAWVSTRAKE